MAGFISDAFAAITNFGTIINKITTEIGNMIQKFMIFEVIAIVIIIGKCIFAAIMFVVQLCIWLFYFVLWLVYPFPLDLMTPKRGDESHPAGFTWWLIRYIIVIAYKVINLPKCFIWYFVDTAVWTMYLPFRFIFWMLDLFLGLGIVKAEHKAWDFLDQIDYFLHGKPKGNYFMFQYAGGTPKTDADDNDPDALNLGLHVIHFPDSVMYQCYSVNPFRLADLAPFPMESFMAFMKCAMNPF